MSISLKVSVKIDRKAALLAGKVCNEREEIEVTQEGLGEHWKTLVEGLDMDSNPPVAREMRSYGWSNIELPDPSEAALVAHFAARAVEAEQERVKKEIDREQFRAGVQESLIPKECPIKVISENEWQVNCKGQDYETLTGWRRSRIWSPDEVVRAEFESQIDALEAQVQEHNRALVTQAWPRIKAERERLAAEKAEADAKAAAEAETARLAKFATRLATGYWELETSSYNERRHSAPWCAKVTFPNGAKPVYEFGESTGKWGHSGLLRIACKPGEIIAWGQKDLRRPDKSDHNMLIMRPDGGMDDTNRTEAFHHWQAQQKTA